MADYSIYVLDEADISLTGGAILDGVIQGNGSHLVGEFLTLNNNGWNQINISDGAGSDEDFADNDGSQRLDGGQTIDGTLYADGTRVEAEYSFIVEDPDGNQYTVVAFNVVDSSPPYATIEGLAFIGDVGGFLPVGVPLEVISAAEGPSFPAPDFATPPCFVRGTRIRTKTGYKRVETLSVGDEVLTQSQEFQKVMWIGSVKRRAHGHMAPVLFRKGSIGNTRDLRVSP
ncbi:Hint domain-containing protein [Sulfitobacter sp. 1151]|uniref:Hint domain-containing protein n=1 Tax=Parasulfitobacter algicola TaxID=2614809 RepID=A0ABX2IU76_9RHOB|nr:Hint domain-containing protein [Sulfitobacter algicola]